MAAAALTATSTQARPLSRESKRLTTLGALDSACATAAAKTTGLSGVRRARSLGTIIMNARAASGWSGGAENARFSFQK